jgi:WD40 repeat protein
VLAVLLAVLLGYEIVREVRVEAAHQKRQKLVMQLAYARQMALGGALDHALTEAADAAKEVGQLQGGKRERSMREQLAFSVRVGLISVLRAASDVRSIVIHENLRLNAVAVRPTDGLVAYGGTGGKVRFYLPATSDVPSTSDVACANPETHVHSLAFNRQGTLLGLGCEDGTVEVWSTSGWKRVDQWLAHRGKKIQALTFDRVGTVVASVGGEDSTIRLMPLNPDGTRKLAEMKEAKPLSVAQATGGFWSAAFSPKDDSLLVAGDGDRGLWLCDVGDSWKCESKGKVRTDDDSFPNNAVLTLAFSPDGTCVAAGSWEGKVSLWDSKLWSGQEVATEKGLAVLSLAFTNSRGLAVGWSNLLRFIPLDGSSCKGAARAPSEGKLVGDEIAGLAFHGNSGLLAAATAAGYVAVIDVNQTHEGIAKDDYIRKVVMPREIQKGVEPWGWRGALATDEDMLSRLVVGRFDLDKLFVVNIHKNGTPTFDDPIPAGQGGVRRVTASARGNRVATLGDDDSIKFWKLGAKLAEDDGLKPLSPAGTRKLANEAAGKQEQPLPFPENASDNPQRILLSPAGDLLACLFTGKDKGVLMINLADQSAYKWVPTKDMAASEIAFSDDGTLFAAGGGDRVLLWEVSAGGIKLRNTKDMTLTTPFAGKLSELAVAATPDGKAVVVAGSNNGQLSVWDAKTGDRLQTLRTDSRAVYQMAFVKSKNLLAAADSFGRVTLWDTGEWQPEELTSRSEPIRRTRFLSFALGGDVLVNGDDDLTIWNIDEESLRGKICKILARPSDVSERVVKACDTVRPAGGWRRFLSLERFWGERLQPTFGK